MPKPLVTSFRRSSLPLRCLRDGRFMNRLAGGDWHTCTCGALRCADPDVEFGLSLMRATGFWS